jgi:hypothetical protein
MNGSRNPYRNGADLTTLSEFRRTHGDELLTAFLELESAIRVGREPLSCGLEGRGVGDARHNNTDARNPGHSPIVRPGGSLVNARGVPRASWFSHM